MNRLTKMVSVLAATGFALGVSGLASANIVANGSFETGDFTGWTQSGNTGFTGVECPGVGFAGPGDGACDAFFGPVGSIGTITQNLTTVAGVRYEIAFDFDPDGGTPSSFSATFGGTTLTSLNNPPDTPYQVLRFQATATGATTALSFNFRDDPGFLKLDSVAVAQAPEPGTMALLGIGMAGLWWKRRKTQ
jgi:PEP-CTERM motif